MLSLINCLYFDSVFMKLSYEVNKFQLKSWSRKKTIQNLHK